MGDPLTPRVCANMVILDERSPTKSNEFSMNGIGSLLKEKNSELTNKITIERNVDRSELKPENRLTISGSDHSPNERSRSGRTNTARDESVNEKSQQELTLGANVKQQTNSKRFVGETAATQKKIEKDSQHVIQAGSNTKHEEKTFHVNNVAETKKIRKQGNRNGISTASEFYAQSEEERFGLVEDGPEDVQGETMVAKGVIKHQSQHDDQIGSVHNTETFVIPKDTHEYNVTENMYSGNDTQGTVFV